MDTTIAWACFSQNTKEKLAEWINNKIRDHEAEWGYKDYGNSNLFVAGMHHMIHHRGRGHCGHVSSLLLRLRCVGNRVPGKGEAPPGCSVLGKWDVNHSDIVYHAHCCVFALQRKASAGNENISKWYYLLTALMTRRMGTVAWVMLSSLRGRDLALPPERSPKSRQPDSFNSTWESNSI